MNCENIKKDDKVVVFFQSTFSGPSKTEHTVTRVYKNTIVIDNGVKFDKKDGRNIERSPFNTHKIIEIKNQ
jgi:ribosomal protein L24